MTRFDEGRRENDPRDSGGAVDCFSGQSFDLGDEGRRYRADRATLRAIDHILENPGELTFERVKTVVKYLHGESFADRFPGAVRVDHRYFLDPEPKQTPLGAVFQGHRLHIERSIYDPDIIIGVSLNPHFIQFGSGALLTSGVLSAQVGERKVADWLIRIPVGDSLEVDRSVLRHRYLEIRNIDSVSSPSLGDLSQVRIGTPASLELVNLPGRIVMADSRPAFSSPLSSVCGSWRHELGVYGEGVHLKAECSRIPGFFRDRAVAIRNSGDVPFFLYFEESRKG